MHSLIPKGWGKVEKKTSFKTQDLLLKNKIFSETHNI